MKRHPTMRRARETRQRRVREVRRRFVPNAQNPCCIRLSRAFAAIMKSR